MRFSTFVLKNVFRRRVRSLLTMTGIAVAVGAVVALVGIADSFSRSLLDLYQKRGIGLIVSRSDVVNPLTGTFPQALGEEIAQLDGVDKVAPGLVDVLSFENLGAQNIAVQGWPAWSFMFGELKILEGNCLTESFKGRRGIMLGKNLAENLHDKGLKLNSQVSICDEEFQVVGIYESDNGMENSMAILLLEDAQKLMGKAGQITGCTVKIKDPSDEGRAAIRTAIEGPLAEKLKLKGKLRATPPSEYVNSTFIIRASKAMAFMTSAVALFIGAIFMLNTMVMSVFERTREIGILRAIGWRPSRIMRMILMESIILSVGGGMVGTGFAVAMTWVLSKQRIVSGAIEGNPSPRIILTGFVIAVVVGLIGAAYPAYRGARLLPTEAIRHE